MSWRGGLLVVDDQPASSTEFLCPPGSHRMVSTETETYCAECGYSVDLPPVLTHRFIHDRGGETWVLSSAARGLPMPRLGTLPIGRRQIDGKGHRMPWQAYRKTIEMSRVDRPDKNPDAAINQAQLKLQQLKEALGIPSAAILEAQKMLEAEALSVFRGTTALNRTCAVLYVVLRSPRFRTPLSMREITDAAGQGVDVRLANRLVSRVKCHFHITEPVPNSVDFLRFFAQRLGLTRNERELVEKNLRDERILEVYQGSPRSLAAGMIWWLGKNGQMPVRTQEQIGKEASVTMVTIRNVGHFLDGRLGAAR
jgi:transcription initiation factor TFIIIB Brf1 subunit/transcription initiation factor TFIIB